MVSRGTAQLVPARPIAKMIDAFIRSQDVKPSSRATYRRTIRIYFDWVEKRRLDLGSITRAHILQYKDSLLADGLSSLTVGSYLVVVRKFYEWAEASKLYPNVARGVKTPRRKQAFRKEALSPGQATKLLDHFRGRGEEGARDYALVNLLLRTGLRTIEVMNANIEDITFKHGKRLLLVQGKGEVEKTSFVILTDKTYEPIRAYLAERESPTSSEPLFISCSNNSQGKRLSTRSISQIAKDGLKAIGLDSKHLTAHSLRHTLAVSILRAGGSLTDAQGVLRHASPTTTQIYTRSIEEELRIKNAPEELLDDVF